MCTDRNNKQIYGKTNVFCSLLQVSISLYDSVECIGAFLCYRNKNNNKCKYFIKMKKIY